MAFRPIRQKKDVFFESDIKNIIPNHTLGLGRPDYVLCDNFKNPIAIIEAKAGGTNLEKALDQATGYAEKLNIPLIFAMNNGYCESRHLSNQKPLFINEQEVHELIKIKEALKFITEKSNEIYTVPKQVILSRQELISIFKNLNNSLRSEGIRAGIDRLTEFANILFLKLYTENQKNTVWDILKETHDLNLIDTINNTLNRIQKEYNTNIFSNMKIQNPETVKEIISRLDTLQLSSIDTDIKGDAFEYFLQQATATSNDLGEYFTPRHIVKTIVNLADPKFKETIYDPFCGTGGFLTEAFNHIKDNTIIETPEDKKQLTEKTIYGGEITTNARLAKMNMILHGDGHNGVEKIDSLANPRPNQYDIVITNMPFSQKIVKEIYDKELKKTVKKTQYTDLYYNGLGKKSGDAVCILHCFNALKEGGRMALVVPEGVLFKKELADLRKFLMDHSKLEAVISLPQGVFSPYTGVKTNILYFTNCKTAQTKDKVWFFNIKNDGFTLDNHRKPIKENDLKHIGYTNFNKKTNEEELKNIGFLEVSLDEIKKNNYDLSVNKYLKEEEVSSEWDMVELGEIINYEQPTKYIVDDTLYNDNYKTPVLTAGQTFILGYTNEEKNIFQDNLPIIIFDDFTTDTKYVDFSFKVKSSAMKLLHINKTKANVKYIYHILQNINFNHSTHKRYWISEYSKIKIPLPSLDIQNKIVEEIDEYQKIINGCKEVTENWKPKFEIKEEWEKVEFEKTIKKIKYTEEVQKTDFLNSGKFPIIDQSSKFISGYWDNEKNLYKITRPVIIFGDHTRIFKYIDFDFIIGADGIKILEPIELFNPKFYYYILKNIEIKNLGYSRHYKILKDLKIPLPSLAEQEEIVEAIQEQEVYIDGCKKLIEIYEEKIKNVMNKVIGS